MAVVACNAAFGGTSVDVISQGGASLCWFLHVVCRCSAYMHRVRHGSEAARNRQVVFSQPTLKR